jgi:hypothetical protein
LQVVTAKWAQDTWGQTPSESDNTSITRQERIYKGLYMMPESASLYQASQDWIGYWIAATWNGKIYVIKENFDPWRLPDSEATLIHELTHIWQHGLSNPITFDQDKAHAALIEGDASFMNDYFVNWTKAQSKPISPSVDNVLLSLIDNSRLDGVYPDIPGTISNLNYFPYTQGGVFVSALYQNGGWATINRAYEGYSPETTEQILHPEKYFANETAQPVSAPTTVDNTWTLIPTSYGQSSNTYGEFFIQDMLGNWLKANCGQEAQKAAAGWGGDKFIYYEKGNDYLFTWNITWGSADDALEFYQAFNNMMNLTGANQRLSSEWYANGRYLTLNWDQTSLSTLIACSSIEAAVLPSAFK